MSKPPRCKICGAEHWGATHQFAKIATLAGIPVLADYSKEPGDIAIVSRETFDWDRRERESGLRS